MLSDYTQSDQDASCLDLAGCNPSIPKQYIITLIMKNCLGWDSKVSEQKLGTFLAKQDRSSATTKLFRSINEPECTFEFSTKIKTLHSGYRCVNAGWNGKREVRLRIYLSIPGTFQRNRCKALLIPFSRFQPEPRSRFRANE